MPALFRSSLKNKTDFSSVLLSLVLFGMAGCTGFHNAMELQDDYASTFSKCKSTMKIKLSKEFRPKITRGFISTTYSAVLPKGDYTPVASSAGRTFYQSPAGFNYSKGSRTESKVGGIVQVNKNNLTVFYVWAFMREYEHYEIDPDGDWVNEVKPGLFNLPNRPWIEEDLKIETDS